MQFTVAAVLAAAIPAVSAHGYVSSIIAEGTTYIGSNPNWYYQPSGDVVPTAGWFAYNQDNGFVAPDSFATNNIACHKNATVGNLQVPVKPGDKISLVWNTWPTSHHGPVINYLAKAPSSFSATTESALTWSKIDQAGLVTDNPIPGDWATDTLITNNFTGFFTVPADLAPGNYVLRHEILALHAAMNADGAQSYPQCINLLVSGSGSTALPTGVSATTFYTATDPGILVDIYSAISSYTIPGPALWSGKRKRDHARDVSA